MVPVVNCGACRHNGVDFIVANAVMSMMRDGDTIMGITGTMTNGRHGKGNDQASNRKLLAIVCTVRRGKDQMLITSE